MLSQSGRLPLCLGSFAVKPECLVGQFDLANTRLIDSHHTTEGLDLRIGFDFIQGVYTKKPGVPNVLDAIDVFLTLLTAFGLSL